MATIDFALAFSQSFGKFLLQKQKLEKVQRDKDLEKLSKEQSEKIHALATADALVRAAGLTPADERASDILLDQSAISKDPQAGLVSLAPGITTADQEKFFKETVIDAAQALAGGMTPQQTVDLFDTRIKDFDFRRNPAYRELKRELGGNVDLAVQQFSSETSALGAIATAKRNRAKAMFDSVGGDLSKLSFPGLINFVDLIGDAQLGRQAIQRYSANRTVQAISEFEANVERVGNAKDFAADPGVRVKLRENGVKKLMGVGMKIGDATKYVEESLRIRFASDKTWQESRKMAQQNYFSLYKRNTTGANQILLSHYKKQRLQFATKEEIKKHPPQVSVSPVEILIARNLGVTAGGANPAWSAYVDWAFENLDENGSLNPLAAVRAIDTETRTIHQALAELSLKDSGVISSDNLIGIGEDELSAALSGFLVGRQRVAGP